MKKIFLISTFILAILGVAEETHGQVQSLYNATNTYTLARLLASTTVVDTVTNTGSGALYTRTVVKGNGPITIEVIATKVSGTVGGTITIQGSLDGVNYSPLNTMDTQTALATKTASDGSANYNWRITVNSFPYYQVGW